MGNYNDAVVADLQCRFSEGEVVTWEEFYKWIDDIEDGFDSHAHDGTSGGGPVLSIDNMSGIVALKARVTALEGAGYATQGYVDTAVTDMATQAWVNSLGLATEAWVALEGFATEAYVSTYFYNKSLIDAQNMIFYGLIGDNETDIGVAQGDIFDLSAALLIAQGDISDIEADYTTQTWVSANFYNKSLIDAQNVIFYGLIGDNEDDIGALDGRVDAIELDYATEAYVISWAGQARDDAKAYADTLVVGLLDETGVRLITDPIESYIDDVYDDAFANTGDISALDGRVTQNEGDILDNAGDISDVAYDLSNNYWTDIQVESAIDDDLSDHESTCTNWTG